MSSFHTAAISSKPRLENIGIKRKTKKGHTLIAEATCTSGDTVAKQMRKDSSVSHELERAKLEAQNKFFSDQIQLQTIQLEFQKEKEACMQKNVKLSIMTQQEMVQCLGALADVLKQGLTPLKALVSHNGLAPYFDVLLAQSSHQHDAQGRRGGPSTSYCQCLRLRDNVAPALYSPIMLYLANLLCIVYGYYYLS